MAEADTHGAVVVRFMLQLAHSLLYDKSSQLLQ